MMNLLEINSSAVENNYTGTGELTAQQNLSTTVQVIEHDFRKIGYCADWQKIPIPTKAGNVYLDNDIVYYNDPGIDPNSTDLLGIVAKNNVQIANNLANSSDINVHASIYAEQGGFGAGWSSFTQPNGFINLYGGIQNKTRVQIGVINNGNIWGFNRRYKYDERLMIMAPPGYPGTGDLEIVSWLE